jgi:ribosomal protein L11 methyltransferase
MGAGFEDALAALLDDFSPIAIQDLAELPLPPGGLWDPTFPPIPDPPPAPLHWRVFFSTPDGRDAARRALSSSDAARRALSSSDAARLALSSSDAARLARSSGHAALQLRAENVSDEDWAARSQRDLTAVRAGRFLIAPPWDMSDAGGATIVIIEPSRGFGTGHHASTRLCLRALSAMEVTGKHVLDLGTGSGVLAIAAALSGARSVKAVDVDPDAIESARHSATLNPLATGIDWHIGDFRDRRWETLSGCSADLVLANLTGGMLISSAERIRDFIASGGTLICSGFDANERPGVERALDLPVCADDTEDGWVGLVLSPVRQRDAAGP